MSDTSARLVDDTFPGDVPVRQWVLSLPMQIRYRLAYDGKLLSAVLRVFLRVVKIRLDSMHCVSIIIVICSAFLNGKLPVEAVFLHLCNHTKGYKL